MKRKDFINGLGTLTVALTCTGLFNACTKKENNTSDNSGGGNTPVLDFTLDLNDVANAALNNVGGSLIKSVSGVSVIIINIGGNTFSALSRTCPHANCLVNYDAAAQKLPCPCHGSKFDLNGTVLNGPATKSLVKYNTSLTGSVLRVFA